jgi:Tol biopolymer transport system component
VYADAVTRGKKTIGLLYRVNVGSGVREALYEARTRIEGAAYSPDGSHIAFLVADEEPDEGDDDAPNCAPPANSLWVLTVGTKAPIKMHPTGPATVGDFSWSPDGKLLVIDSGGSECEYPGTLGEVFVISIDQKTDFKLSEHAPSLGPRFSPDGKHVLFTDFGNYQAVLTIGNLATRELKPLARQLPSDDYAEYDQVVDWK